jgi:hypothetical protein
MVDLDRDYAKSLKHIAKKLGLPKRESDQLRLAHVRDGGREVEIWDGKSPLPIERGRGHFEADGRFRLSGIQGSSRCWAGCIESESLWNA